MRAEQHTSPRPHRAAAHRRHLCVISAQRKNDLLAHYRVVQTEVQRGGVWKTIGPGASPAQFVFSVWNPGGRRLSIAENHRADADLIRLFIKRGVMPLRTRSTSVPIELGWMIPYQPHRTVQLLRAFGQLAGIVLLPHAPEVLWVDGSASAL